MALTQEQLSSIQSLRRKFKSKNDFITFLENSPFSDRVPTQSNKAIEEVLGMLKSNINDVVFPVINVQPYCLPSNYHFNTYMFLQHENQERKWKHIFGWDITTNKEGTYAESEYHSVIYHKDDNIYMDTTPHTITATNRWFLPD
jgi:hypothetical protein